MTDKYRNVIIVILFVVGLGWYVADSRARTQTAERQRYEAVLMETARASRVHFDAEAARDDAFYNAQIIAAGCR